ncbi:MAG: ChbG/HpnK family deacetylase [Alphaproteobacteria bacterium]
MSLERVLLDGRDRPARIPVVLCADDYGLAPGVSAAIRELLGLGRLSATSCMSLSPHWPTEGPALAPYREQADLGLHLTLTDHAPLGPMPALAPAGRLPPLSRLMARSFLGGLERSEVEAEIDRQIDRFEAVIGAEPAFLDGHQHVHVLPVIRDIVLDRCKGRLARRKPYLRTCVESAGAILARGIAPIRALIISVLASRLDRSVREAGLRANSVFRGVRSFGPDERYGEIFPRYLAKPIPQMLIACHPGRVDGHLAAVDPVTAPREDELDYFLGDRFPRDLEAAGVTLARLGAPGRAG